MAYTRALLVTQRVLVTLQVLVMKSCTAAVGVRQETTDGCGQQRQGKETTATQWDNR